MNRDIFLNKRRSLEACLTRVRDKYAAGRAALEPSTIQVMRTCGLLTRMSANGRTPAGSVKLLFVSTLWFRTISHARKTFEIGILCPKRGATLQRRRVDDTIGERQAVPGGIECE